MALLYRAPDDREAALLVSALDARGIACRTVGGAASGSFGELGVEALQVDLHVAEEDLVEARRIVETEQERARQSRESGVEWTCAGCGETNDSGFDVCWSCQRDRPAAS